VWEQHISIFGICEDVRHFSQHSYNINIHSHNGQLKLHTDPHVGGKDNIGRQIQTTVQWNSSNSGTVRNRTRTYTLSCLEWSILWTFQNTDRSSSATLYNSNGSLLLDCAAVKATHALDGNSIYVCFHWVAVRNTKCLDLSNHDGHPIKSFSSWTNAM
jgi:hypothetical protein